MWVLSLELSVKIFTFQTKPEWLPKRSCIWQLSFYFVNMNLVPMQAFHAQSKSIFICLGNTPAIFFCFLIFFKYFHFIKAFYLLFLFIPCRFPAVLLSYLYPLPYIFAFYSFKMRNLSLLPLNSQVAKGQICWQKSCWEDWPWRLAASWWEESPAPPPTPIVLLCLSGAVGTKGRKKYCQHSPALGLCSEGLDKARQ